MIHIVVALPCEARPIIDHYRLSSLSGIQPFKIYRNQSLRLIVSGIGKLAAAAATGYLYSRFEDAAQAAWLNVGIAGHPGLDIGDCRIAEQVIDQSSQQSWYPGLTGIKLTGGPVTTVDQPTAAFTADSCYDMEASGFMAAALRFSNIETVQCVKVISDNHRQTHHHVTAKLSQQLIKNQLPAIGQIIDVLHCHSQILARQFASPEHWPQFLRRWHFTATEQHQLRRLLQNWQVRRPDESAWNDGVLKLPDAKQVLAWLQHQLNTAIVEL